MTKYSFSIKKLINRHSKTFKGGCFEVNKQY